MHPQLSEYFVGAAGKTLSTVETSRQASNQHEFNGVKALTDLLGEPIGRAVIPARFIYLDDELPTTESEGTLTWYDARRPARQERGVMRWEYRLYYADNPVLQTARGGTPVPAGALAPRRTAVTEAMAKEAQRSLPQPVAFAFNRGN